MAPSTRSNFLKMGLSAMMNLADDATYDAHSIVTTLQSIGVNDRESLMLVTDADIKGLHFSPPEENMVLRIKKWAVGKDKAADWATLTIDKLISETSDSVATPSATSTSRSFESRIKVDMNAYKELKDDSRFRVWNRETLMAAYMHGLSDIFDEKVVAPTDADGLKEWNLKQSVVMSIFVNTLKTAKSLQILRKHLNNRTAKACYQELVTEYCKGTFGKIQVRKAEKTLRDFKFDESKSHMSFVTGWLNKLKDYEEIKDAPASDGDKLEWFTDALQASDALRAVIDTTTVQDQRDGKDTDFNTLITLVSSMAISKDSYASITKSKLKANQAETGTPSAKKSGGGGGRGAGRGGAGRGMQNPGRGTGRGGG